MTFKRSNPELIYACLVISETRTASNKPKERFSQIDNEQYDSQFLTQFPA